MQYSLTLLALALATLTSALPTPALAPSNSLAEKRNGGHGGPPGPPSWGQSDQSSQSWDQSDDTDSYTYNPNPDKDVQEAEDNITWSHASGGNKKRNGGHGGPPPPPGPPGWGHDDGHKQQQQQQQQSSQSWDQGGDDEPYTYNPNPDKDVQEAEDNITWSHAGGGN